MARTPGRIRGLTALVIAAGALVLPGTSMATPRSCPEFAYQGSRIIEINVAGISCRQARALVDAAYRAAASEEQRLGQYVHVRTGWRCTVFRQDVLGRYAYDSVDCRGPESRVSWRSRTRS
jgi:hypothetical protein